MTEYSERKRATKTIRIRIGWGWIVIVLGGLIWVALR